LPAYAAWWSIQPPPNAGNQAGGSQPAYDVLRYAFIVAESLCIGMLLGAVFVFWHDGLHAATSLVWALACLATGALVGFLFGIPRVEQADRRPESGSPQGPTPALAGLYQEDYRQRVNTNLEQISDWLTKIIVGLGLVELKYVPGHLESVAAYQEASSGVMTGPAFAGALIVYFSIVKIDIRPLQAKQFALPHSTVDCQHVQGVEPILLRCMQELLHLVAIVNLHFLLGGLGTARIFTGIVLKPLHFDRGLLRGISPHASLPCGRL
jgi:hypothetical protein